MDAKLTTKAANWMTQALDRADASNDVPTKVGADGKYIRTPWELCEEIVGQIAAQSPLQGKKILVVDTVEFIPVLLAFGAEKCNITYVAPYEYKGTMIAGIIGVRVVQQTLLEWKPDMKFDVVVGNPPYQDGDTYLYVDFFKKSLKMGKIVSMVMPSKMDSASSKLRPHNLVVERHLIQMSDNVADFFRVGIPDIRNIIASEDQYNSIEEKIDPLGKYQIKYPERKRLSGRRGMEKFGRAPYKDPNGIPCIGTIHRGGKIQWVSVKSEIAQERKSTMVTNAPYLLFLMEHPSKGLFNTVIRENDGTNWGSGVFALDCKSKEEAEKLEKWLTSNEIQAEVSKILSLKNTYSISGPMLSLLPWYE